MRESCENCPATRKGLNLFDCNYLNVLVRNSEVAAGQNNLLLIDHESTWMGRRGNTIAGHFMNRTIRWSDPTHKVIPNGYPGEEKRREFVSDYVEELSKVIQADPLIDSVEHVMLEVDFSILTVLLYFEFLFKDISQCVRFGEAFMQIVPHLIHLYNERKQYFLKRYPEFKDEV